MRRILITGGSGFLGHYVCKECEKRNIDYIYTSSSNTKENNRSYVMDLNDERRVEKIVKEYNPDAIIHLAAIASPTHDDASMIYKVNVCGTENLLKAAAGLNKKIDFILISTAGVYGNQKDLLLKELLPYNPLNHYSYSKMITEFLSKQYADLFNIIIVRPFNIVGIGQKETFFVSKLVKAFRSHEQKIFLGNLDAVRDYASVEFCASVLLDLVTINSNRPDIVNICTGVGYSCLDVFNILCDLSGYRPELIVSDNFVRKNEIWRMVGDPNRLSSFLKGRYKSEPLECILKRLLTFTME